MQPETPSAVSEGQLFRLPVAIVDVAQALSLHHVTGDRCHDGTCTSESPFP
jgi:hypothetical protein